MKIQSWKEVLDINEKPWMKKYIDKKTNIRTKSKTELGKFIPEVFVTSLYGKQSEALRQIKKSICNWIWKLCERAIWI